MQYIKIHSLDNVAVALADLTEGDVVTLTTRASRCARRLFVDTSLP
jgi:hypothetical protein